MFFLIWTLTAAVLLVMTFIYFAPTLIAHTRKHHNRSAIFVFNLLLGWSFFGWVASLSWSLTRVELK